MTLQPKVRRWHRWLSVVIGLQLLAWTVSGFVFTLVPIAEIRGEHVLRDGPPPGPPPDLAQAPTHEWLVQAGGLRELSLAPRGAQWAWWVWVGGALTLYDPTDGRPLPELTPFEVRELVRARLALDARVVSSERVEHAHGEYRDKPVPAWCVRLDDAQHTAVYVDALTAEVTAVRTDAWRRFDWFWMLHIMDYDARSDFGTPLLRVAAGLGVTSALSGLLLAVLVLRPRRRVSPVS